MSGVIPWPRKKQDSKLRPDGMIYLSYTEHLIDRNTLICKKCGITWSELEAIYFGKDPAMCKGEKDGTK